MPGIRSIFIARAIAASVLVAAMMVAAPSRAQPGLPAVPESARAKGAFDGDVARVETRLLFDAESVPAGGSLRVGVLLAMDPDWHVYWRNSGEAGLPTRVDFSGDGLRSGALRWPAPHIFDMSDEITTFGYADRVLFFAPAQIQEDAEGALQVSAAVDYLACKIDCIPGNATLRRELPVGPAEPASEAVQALFDEAAARVPVSPADLGIAHEVQYSQDAVRPGDTFRAAVGLVYCARPDADCSAYDVVFDDRAFALIPDDTAQVAWQVTAVRPHPTAASGQVLDLLGEASPNAAGADERLSGVVHLEGEQGERLSLLIDAPLPRAASDASVEALSPTLIATADLPARASAVASEVNSTQGRERAPPDTPISLAYALLLAFAGGLILNLMPCVFPVLAIKVTAFARVVHEGRATILAHGAAYTAGIVGSMLALGATVVGLRTAGRQVGWGFQFQEPLFLVALSAVLVLFALNLFGVFEVSLTATQLSDRAQHAHGLRRSALEGVLAVVLATPCSAPFLGTAVGFALASNAATILGVFAVLGLGLAAPFVLLTLSPGWAKLLPRPGEWMNVLKQLLGFALIGTVIWLGWILGQVLGAEGLVQMLIFLTIIAAAAWVFGQVQYAVGGVKKLGVLAALIAFPVASGVWVLDFEAARAAHKRSNAAGAAQDGLTWQPWTEEAVARELSAGRAVFVNFTADWCMTCKVNERLVLNADPVREAVAEHDVALFKADWTEPDERIRAKLEEFGKGGVPMYLVYRPERLTNPEVLPETLTADTVIRALTDHLSE